MKGHNCSSLKWPRVPMPIPALAIKTLQLYPWEVLCWDKKGKMNEREAAKF